MNEFAITAIGQDRPGIVASFTEVLLQLGCNLADCSMSLLRNQFAMILLVDAPPEMTAERLNAAVEGPAGRLGLVVETRRVLGDPAVAPSMPFVLSVYGRDRPGIVHTFAKALGDAGVNITDLRSHLAGVDLYAMILDIAVPPSVDPDALVRSLQGIAEEMGVNATVRPTDAAEL
jgi:glycine cleavage system transcriptional repressor